MFLTNGINVHIWCHITINWLSGLHYNRYWHGNLQRHKWYRRRLQLNAHHIMLVTPSKASTDLQILFEICPWWHFGCQNAGFSLKLELIFLILRRNKIFIDNRTQRAARLIWDCQLTRWVFKSNLHETAGYNILIQSFISRFHAPKHSYVYIGWRLDDGCKVMKHQPRDKQLFCKWSRLEFSLIWTKWTIHLALKQLSSSTVL